MFELDSLDIIKKSRPLFAIELSKEIALWSNLATTVKHEETSSASDLELLGSVKATLIQTFSMQWKRQYIPCIGSAGKWIEGGANIGSEFARFFGDPFGNERDFRFKENWSQDFVHKDPINFSSLEAPFSLDEIKKPTFDLSARPDGFPLLFL